MEMKPAPVLVFKGPKEICGAVGVSYKEIVYYVEKEGLPAFQIREGGLWIAIPEDMKKWIEKQRDIKLKRKK